MGDGKKLKEYLDEKGTNVRRIAKETGISVIDAYKTAYACKLLGAGRERKSDDIDYSAGIYLNKIFGEYVHPGEVIATLYANNQEKIDTAANYLKDAIIIDHYEPNRSSMIYRTIWLKL